MNFARTIGIPTLLFTLLSAPALLGQAAINENLEKAHLYVDVVTGSDSNPGTSAKPFRTIGRGINAATVNNQNRIGTLVTINPGTYRESLSISKTGRSTSLPMTFAAAKAGTVVVSGADTWKGWAARISSPGNR